MAVFCGFASNPKNARHCEGRQARGNPVDRRRHPFGWAENPRDCHVASLLAMTCSFGYGRECRPLVRTEKIESFLNFSSWFFTVSELYDIL